MNVHDIANGALFFALGVPVVLAQTADAATIMTSSLVQLGAIGIMLGWLTLVHLPSQTKAGEKREEAADKREVAWRASLESQMNRAEAERTRILAEHEKTMTRVADALAALAASKIEQTRAIEVLARELQSERRVARSGSGN